jgi:nitroreductase / dihydropteridine reductase
VSIESSAITDALKWRYAVQAFDKEKRVPVEDIETILESARLAPGSLGVEPWKFLVVENTDLREKLRAAGYGQAKITDASHLVVVTSRTDIKENISNERIDRTAKTYNVDPLVLEALKNVIDMHMNSKTEAELESWARAQTYIAIGMMLQTAALLEIDSGPMEGFDPGAVDKILGLEEKHLHATCMIAFGYRDSSDPAAARPKVRRDFDDVVEFLK